MNQTEFKEFQTEMVDIIVSYEQFCKKGYLLDLKYNSYFYEYIVKEYKLQTENQLLYSIIVQLGEKKTKKDIEKNIQQAQENYAKAVVSLSQKNLYAKGIIEANKVLSNEVIDEFERVFKEFCSKYHPAIKGFITPNESSLYERLRLLYCENNYNGFTAFYEMNKNNLKAVEIEEKKMNEASANYYRIMEQIKFDVNDKKNKYPYIKEAVFDDEITIAGEEAEFRIRLNKLVGMNKSLHKDLVNLYEEDINLA